MAKVKQSHQELCQHLREQFRFLKNSAQAYDEGFSGEAKRLATVVRVLLHDTGVSRSLLKTLGVKEKLRYYDKLANIDRQAALFFCGVSMRFTQNGMQYFASLDQPKEQSRFSLWWEGIVLKNHKQGVEFDRKKIILAVANMEGGTHVAPELTQAYAALSRHNSMGLKVYRGGKKAFVENGPELPIVRQCANELILTLEQQIPTLLALDLNAFS